MLDDTPLSIIPDKFTYTSCDNLMNCVNAIKSSSSIAQFSKFKYSIAVPPNISTKLAKPWSVIFLLNLRLNILNWFAQSWT